MAGWLRSLVIDLSPLRDYRQFRLLWASAAFTMLGRTVVTVALPYQVFLLTHSSLAVGLVGLAQLAPLLVVGVYGGPLADRVDRRSLQAVGKAGVFVSALAFMSGSLGGLPVAWFYGWAAVSAGFNMLDQAARGASVPRIVSRQQYPGAAALNQTLFQAALVVGPSLAGLILARAPAAAAFGVELATSLPAALCVLAMAPLPPIEQAPPVRWSDPVDSVRFVAARQTILGIFLADLVAMIFGMPLAAFPALALKTWHLGAAGLGLLYAAPGAGALVGTLLSGWVRSVHWPGRAIFWAIATWGLAIAAFGLTGGYLPAALALLALAGASDMVSAIFRNTVLQLSIPDSVRGRMSAFNIMVVTAGPRLGDLETGVVAALVNPVFSVVSGGVACLAGIALLTAWLPELRNYRSAGRLLADAQ